MMRLGKEYSVNIFLADSQPSMRRVLRHSLRELGFETFQEFSDYKSLVNALEFACPDLAIIDFELEGGNVCQLIEKIRSNTFGSNPFLPIMVTAWERSANIIHDVVNSGVDGLLVKPLSTRAIGKQIDDITHKRRPFVASSGYIGPDRRKTLRPGDTAKRINPPNVLQAKRNGEEISNTALNNIIADEVKVLNIERLRQNAREIARLIPLIICAYEKDNVNEDTQKHLKEITRISRDLSHRVTDTEYFHLSDLCKTLSNISKSIAKKHLTPNEKDLRLLPPLVEAIENGINQDKDISIFAKEISSSVASYKKNG